MRTPVFELHILPMFRALDREHMIFALDLWDYQQLVDRHDEILARLEADMPTTDSGGPWPQEWVDLFRRWGATGFKRLELGTGQYTRTQTATAVTIRATGTLPAPGYRAWLQLESATDTSKTYVLYLEKPDQPVEGDPPPFSTRERYAATDTRSVSVRDITGIHPVV
jgi:hypothetical protein